MSKVNRISAQCSNNNELSVMVRLKAMLCIHSVFSMSISLPHLVTSQRNSECTAFVFNKKLHTYATIAHPNAGHSVACCLMSDVQNRQFWKTF